MELNIQQKEYIKCASDPVYYLNNYGYVFDADKQRVDKMTCYEYQERCIVDFHKYKNNIVLKSRQCLPEGTKISTEKGYKSVENIKVGDNLLSFDLKGKKVENDSVTDFWCSGEKLCYDVYFENYKKVEMGEDHPIFVVERNDWVRASELVVGESAVFRSASGRIRKVKITEVEETGIKLCYDMSVGKNNNFFAEGILTHNTGLSVITAGYVAWRLIFRKDEKILIIANDGDGAVRFLSTVKQFLQYTPKWLMPGEEGKLVINNQKFVQLENNSYAQAKASSQQAGRGDSLTLLVMDETAFIEHADPIWTGAGLALSRTNGKCIMISCVPKETYVFTENGLKQMVQFVDKDKKGGYEIDKYKIFGKDKLREGNLFFNNGLKKTKKNITENSVFEGTLNHKLWACKNGEYGWYENGELGLGDYIAVQYNEETWGNNDCTEDFAPPTSNEIINVFAPKKINKDLAYLIGLYISKGSSYKKYNKNGDFIGNDITITCGNYISGSIVKNGLVYSCCDKLHYSINSKNFVGFLEYLGFDLNKSPKEKEIPYRLLEMSRENIIWMLRGIFDGDGCLKKDNGHVGISMDSKKLIEQIRMLLVNFGVLTDYREVKTKKTNVETIKYKISCNQGFSKVFYKKIGFGFKEKQKNRNILQGIKLKRSSSNDIIPYSIDLVKKIIDESRKNIIFFKKNGVFVNSLVNKKKGYKTKHVNRKLFIKIFDLCKNNISKETVAFIEKILSEDIKWDKINKIEFGEKETFDFSLQENKEDFWCHSVVYNGVIGHQTPNGTGNLYHETWEGYENGTNDFHGSTVHWTENEFCSKGLEERIDENGEKYMWSPWYEEQRKKYKHDKVKIAQELDLSFEGSKRLAIENEILIRYEKRFLTNEYKDIIRDKLYYDYKLPEGKRFTNQETGFHIFKVPERGKKYLLGGDVARGDGKDFSTIQIIDIDSLEVVAEYQGRVSPDLFAHLIYNVAMDYNNAYVVVEANSFGLATTFDLNRKLGYKNMFFSKNLKDIYVTPYKYKVDIDETIPGFQTTRVTRPLIINNLRTHMREGGLQFYSKRLMGEFRVFIQNGERPEAEKGKNDDLIFALAIALFVRDTDYENASKSKDMYRGMLEAFGYSSNSLYGGYKPPNKVEDEEESNDIEQNSIFFKDYSKDNENDEDDDNDLSWLLG